FGSKLADGITSLQNRMEDWIGDMPEGYKVVKRMEMKSIPDSVMKGYEVGSGILGGIGDALNGFKLGNFNSNSGLGNIDKVGEVGKIRDSVDIASEDLKMMRELAEMQNIQNFVTLSPTVTVQTGDINNGYDIDTIIARIEQSMEEEIASSAEGVFV